MNVPEYDSDWVRQMVAKHKAVLDYEIAEGLIVVNEHGQFIHTTPELLEIDLLEDTE